MGEPLVVVTTPRVQALKPSDQPRIIACAGDEFEEGGVRGGRRRLKTCSGRDSWSWGPVDLGLGELERRLSDLGTASRFDPLRNAPEGLRSFLAPYTGRGRNPPSFASGVEERSVFRI